VALTADPQLAGQPMIADLRFFDMLTKPVRHGELMRVLTRVQATPCVRVGQQAVHQLPKVRSFSRQTRIRLDRADGRQLVQRHPAHVARQ
jgi:hypothetical protein